MNRTSYLLAIAVALATAGLPLNSGEGSQAELDSVERLGQLIYQKDRAAWMATDVLLAETDGVKDVSLLGWVTIEVDSGWLVKFLGGDPDAPCTLFEVPLGDTAGELRQLKTCEPLAEDLASMFRARQTALGVLSQPCSASYNTVVLPGALTKESGWLVYLLAASTVPGEIVVGGHSRVVVSSDGRTVIRADPLSNSCLTLPPPAEGGQQAATIVTHVISDTPTEIHVFLGLSHKKPFYVMTEKAMWSTAEGRIRLVMDGEDWESYKKRAQDQAESADD